ncbi:MAG: hypothetical protein ABIO49_14560 [Dokdonella sp.]
MVVAGLVPDGAPGPGFCGDGTKLCSIGLVRYTPTGQRVTWPNAGANGRFSNNYVVYPGGSAASRYQYLHDIKVRGNYIDVLVDIPDSAHPALTLGHRNVEIVTFRDDGSFVSIWEALGHGFQPQDNEDFYGAQMVEMNNTQLIVAATGFDNIGPYIAVSRATILNDGTLTGSGDFGSPYGVPPNTFPTSWVARYYAPGSYCGGSRCDVTAGYVAKQVGFPVQTDFYVAGSIHIGGTNWDAIALKISSADASVKTEFNGTGWSRAVFDDPSSTLDDRAAGLYVYQDDVYMAAQVARKCSNGIGLAKLDGATGADNTAFGSGGKVVFGGEGNSPICLNQGPQAAVPTHIAATGGRIGIVGYQQFKTFGFPSVIEDNPMLAVVNAVNGSVLSFGSYPVTRADGSRYGDAALYGVYGGNLPTSPFTVSGFGRDANSSNTLSYLAGKFIPVSADRIFASGFGNGDEH